MTAYRIITADVRAGLAEVESGSVQCCVTSPPYWGLRSYDGPQEQVWGGEPGCAHEWGEVEERAGMTGGLTPMQTTSAGSYHGTSHHSTCLLCGAWRGALGLEPLHDCLAWARGEPPCSTCYICHLRTVFAGVWRVLRDDGTLWLNLGDSYNGSRRAGGDYGKGGLREGQPKYGGHLAAGLKPKDLCGIPARFALAMQADGWYWRSDIVWAKSAPMPESCTDRPTRSHESVFLLTKSPRYLFDQEAVREKPKPWNGGVCRAVARTAQGPMGGENQHNIEERRYAQVVGANCKDVWTINPERSSEPHYAMLPLALPKRCILAGTSEAGCCAACGAPLARVVEKGHVGQRTSAGRGGQQVHPDGESHDLYATPRRTLAHRPTCGCNAGRRPCLVLDPFSGMAQTGVAALQLGRRYLGIEISPAYAERSLRRLARTAGQLTLGVEG